MKKELNDFRKLMKREGIDLYLTKDADDHISEYSDPFFSSMRFLSGFTGGDGTLAVTEKEAGLWTDGRYFIQAEKELSGSGIDLRKEGEPDCPELVNWIFESIPEGGRLGFDGRCISYDTASELARKLSPKKVRIVCEKDLIGELWTDERPKKRAEKIWKLEETSTGKTASEKLLELRAALDQEGAGATVISAMDEIAWLLNLRGDDVPYNPVFDSFFLMDGESRTLYISKEHLDPELGGYIEGLNVKIENDTEQIYTDISKLNSGILQADGNTCSYRLLTSAPGNTVLLNEMGYCALAKNRKNAYEAANLAKAQRKDSTAVTKFMYWFKKQLAESEELTEMKASEKLHAFRNEQEGFLGDSFETISAYGPNAAMCHYAPSPERPVKIEKKGLYLVDSGGHYPEGTTDITRTWACGPVTEEEKKAYTYTAMANLRLADQIFPDGTSGLTLDLAAREIFWKNGMDYNHGTGHGVGYLLYVHESPAGIRFRSGRTAVYNSMKEGVYVSDEPGFYREGKFGIRLENMLLVKKAFSNEFRSFMKFETMTLVPFDRECIDISLMDQEDIRRYDQYHRRVFETVSPGLTGEEKEWLRKICRPL